MKTLIVDDERLARARLRKLLEAHPEVTVVAEADSVDAAEEALRAHTPDVVFLDVAMPGGSGFDLLARVRVVAAIVFVTAYDEHALRAFDVHAIDYLLKPVSPERLARAIARLGGRPDPAPDRIYLTFEGGARMVSPSDIVIVRAERDYTEVVLRDGATCSQKLPLVRWEARLGPSFVRVHRSTLVSIADIERVERSEGSTCRLFVRGHAEPIVVSRAHASRLRTILRGAGGQKVCL